MRVQRIRKQLQKSLLKFTAFLLSDTLNDLNLMIKLFHIKQIYN